MFKKILHIIYFETIILIFHLLLLEINAQYGLKTQTSVVQGDPPCGAWRTSGRLSPLGETALGAGSPPSRKEPGGPCEGGDGR